MSKTKTYKPRGGTPRRQCRRFSVLMEPALGLRVQWLAQSKGMSYASLVERIVANDREIQNVKV